MVGGKKKGIYLQYTQQPISQQNTSVTSYPVKLQSTMFHELVLGRLSIFL